MNEPDTVLGEPTKRFRVYYCDIDNNPYECEAEYDTISEVLAHRGRPDRRYKIFVGQKIMTRAEFEAWSKDQK
jgi:hypothetical protein